MLKKLKTKKIYKINEYSQLARILWIKENVPEQHEKTWKYLSPNDYIIALLTGGEIVTDYLEMIKERDYK